ncbi:MAG: hypothetical protein VYB09_01335 [Planctomycetota bacterium]|nr:hypothetical protein [Planctomycetota bacterium]
MARTISILLTLVIGISLVALVYGQDRQPREAADRNASTSSRDDSFPLPTDTTVSVLEGDSDAFPAPAVLPPSTLEEAVPVIGQPQAATPSEPYYSRDPVETPSLEQPTSQQFVPRPQLENVETVTVRPLSLENEPRPFPPGAIQATIQDGSLAPGQLPAGSSGPATSTRSRIPDILVEAIGPSTIQVGQGATWKVRATNRDSSPSGQVVLQVQLPRWMELASSQTTSGTVDQGSESGGLLPVSWQLPAIAAGATETWAMKLVPEENKSFDLQLEWSVRPVVLSTAIRVVQPELHVDIDGPGEMIFGQTRVFTVRLTNPGNGDAQGVILQLQPGDARQPVGMIAAGGSKSLELELTAEQAGQMQIRALATAQGLAPVIADQEILIRHADLAVSIRGPSNCFAGVPTVYRMVIENRGDAPAEGIAVQAALPLGARLVGSGQQNPVDNTIAWAVGRVDAGAKRAFEFQCEFTRDGNHPLHVRVTGDGVDPAVDSMTASVQGVADLKLVVNDPQGPRSLEDLAVFELTVMNRGTSPARDVSVIGHFGYGVEPAKVSGARAELLPGQVLFDSIKEIGPGEKVVLKIHAQANVAGRHQFRAEVISRDPETRLVQEEMTWFLDGRVQAASATQE